MSLTVQQEGRFAVVTASDSLDVYSLGPLREACDQAMELAGDAGVVFVAEGVDYADASALGALVLLAKRLYARGGALVAVDRADGLIAQGLTISGLIRAIPVVGSLAEGLGVLGAQCAADVG